MESFHIRICWFFIGWQKTSKRRKWKKKTITSLFRDVHSSQRHYPQSNRQWRTRLYLSLIVNLDRRNLLSFTITIKVSKAKNNPFKLVDKLTIQNVLLPQTWKNKKSLLRLLTQNKLMRLCTECTKEDSKSKKKINFWVEVRSKLIWEIQDFLNTTQLHKTQVEESTINKVIWMTNKKETAQHWFWTSI